MGRNTLPPWEVCINLNTVPTNSIRKAFDFNSGQYHVDSPSLKQLLQRNDVWRACDNNEKQANTQDTGHAVLNRLLPGQGWPAQGLTEFLCPRQGMGELSLLAPALKQLSQQDRWIALLNPPFIPYAPAWAACGVDLSQILVIQTRTEPDRLWALETLLASNTTSAALYWPTRIHAKALRRLQVASKKGRCWGVLFRPVEAAQDASPATLRIQLSAAAGSTENAGQHGLLLKVLKRPGGWPSQTHFIETPRHCLHVPQQGASPAPQERLDHSERNAELSIGSRYNNTDSSQPLAQSSSRRSHALRHSLTYPAGNASKPPARGDYS